MPGSETRLLIPWLNSTSVMINSEKGEVTQPPTTLTLASVKGPQFHAPMCQLTPQGPWIQVSSPPLSSYQQKGAPPTQVQFHSEQTCTATLLLGVHICKRTRLADHLWGLSRSKIGWLHVSTTKMLKVLTSLSPSTELLVEWPFNSYYFVWLLANGMSLEHVSIWNHWPSYSFLPALRTNKIHSNTGIQNSFDLSSENILIISTQC